jgi:hypothetical protein
MKKTKTSGLIRVRPGHGLTCRVDRVLLRFAPAGLLLNPNRFSHQVDPPGRAGFYNQG